MRTMFLLCLLALGAVGCTAPAEQRADPQPNVPQPGTMTARINGQYNWYGVVRSQNP